MKKNYVNYLLLMILCVSLGACNNDPNISSGLTKQADKLSKATENINQNANSNETANKQENLVPALPEEGETFLGDWVIKRDIKTGTVSAYSREDINGLLGKRLTYASNVAIYDGSVCKNPVYKEARYSKKDFFENRYVSFETLGIEGDTITEINIYTDKNYKNTWDSTGSCFLIKDKDTLIVFDQGVYFELNRLK